MSQTDDSEWTTEVAAPVDGAKPADSTVDQLLAQRRSVIAVSRSTGLGALRAIDLRYAAQSDAPGTLSACCDDALVHPNPAAAQDWLRSHPEEAGAVALSGSGADGPVLVERSVRRIDTAIVMAGGRGTRLRPLTDKTPKPLLEVGGRPLIYRILDNMQAHGVRRVLVSVHHLVELVRYALRDGSPWQMTIEFLEEPTPLDTGAGLAMLRTIDRPFFITNGDILTTLDLSALGREHQLSGALATIATYQYPAALPYGVVHRDGARVRRIEEKPVHRYPVNAGIYAFAPQVLDHVEHGRPLAMVDFLNAQAQADPDAIRSFPLIEYWNDIGTHADYERAQADIATL